MKKKIVLKIALMAAFLTLLKTAETGEVSRAESPGKDRNIAREEGTEDFEMEEETDEEEEEETFEFVDASGRWHEMAVDPDAPKNDYDEDGFERDEDRAFYEDDNYTSRVGVDVSHHQGRINWRKVKKSGVEFAFIRIGYRGYGKTGNLALDREFRNNIRNAKKQGIDVGVYFYSQAKNEREALAEANFVLRHLRGMSLDLPVMYDPEHVYAKGRNIGRNRKVSGEQQTENAKVFCERIEEEGYTAGVYANMRWQAFVFDMAELSDYVMWYADYEPAPQTPYEFACWQYTSRGRVPGIRGNVDMNLQIISK